MSDTDTDKNAQEKDELSFNFGKLKKVFKHKSKETETKDEELTFDIKKIWAFFVKHKVLFLLLIPIFLSIFFRAYPLYLPITDTWAQNTVHNYYRSQIEAKINQQYPNLPQANKNALIEPEFQQLLTSQGEVIKQQIQQVSIEYKNIFKDDTGQTYLLGLDDYFFLRQAENILERGHIGDTLVDGKPYDTHALAPKGRFSAISDAVHFYFEAYFYKIIHFFNRDISLMGTTFYVPIILATLSVIPAFFIGKKIAGIIGGLFASIMLAIHPSFMSRVVGGLADTDAYNILFPLLITWMFVESFSAKEIKKRYIYICLSGVFTGLFSLAWLGWWYVFYFIIATMVIMLIYYLIISLKKVKEGFAKYLKLPEVKHTFFLLVAFIASSGIFVSLFVSFPRFWGAINGPFGFLTIKSAVQTVSVWPNVYTTVAELNPATFSAIISNIGGKLLFVIAIAGIILTLTKKDYEKIDIKYFVLFVIWFIATIFASTKGIRFTLLLVPAFSIGFGVALGMIYKYSVKWISKELHIKKAIVSILIILILCLFLIKPLKGAESTVKNEVPMMNDAWWNSLTKIKTNSSDNAIISSWWDFGHWFAYIADRPVTFDGASQNRPQAHWMGKVLLTDDEDIAVGVLRMLDCGANNAFEELDKEVNDTHRSVEIIYEIVVKDKKQAERTLSKYVSEETTKKVLNYTHCEPPEAFFVASDDMVGKSGVWSHFGIWDFRKALVWNKARNMEKEKAVQFIKEVFEDFTAEQAEQMYYEILSLTEQEANNWISPWPSYVSGIGGCQRAEDLIVCSNSIGGQVIIAINLTSSEANIETQQGIKHPKSIVYFDGTEIKEIKFEQDTIPYSIILFPEGENYGNIWSAPELAASMFTRMYFFEGSGLEHFELFDHQRSPTGTNVYIYKVNWEGEK